MLKLMQGLPQIARVCYLLVLSGGLQTNPAAAQQLAFTLVDSEGQKLQVAAGAFEATAVCFLGTQCPMARGYIGDLNALQAAFANSRVRIVGVMSNHQDSADDISAFKRQLGIEFPIVQDFANQIADRYGATRTPEVFLLDRQLKLRYHGRINDRLAPGVARADATREDLRIAIEELLGGRPVSIPETPALGCIIGREPNGRPSAESQRIADTAETNDPPVTFTHQVVRVLRAHCVECHRAGEIGPFAMDSYDEVVGWAETMLETVENGRMPPWHADPTFGSFVNERRMPESDKQVLRDWIAGGLQRGEPEQLPAALPPKVAGWTLPREPDLVVAMRPRAFTVPKDGVVEYQYFVVDPGFEQDMWVTAAEVAPGNRSVVHHAIVFVRPPDGSDFDGIGWLSAYVPGQRAAQLPPGRARLVPAGSQFVFQMHYTPNGIQQDDVTRVGLLFTTAEQVTHQVMTLMALNQDFEIPPHAKSHRVQATTHRLPANGELLALAPHMHVRGKSFRVFADNLPPSANLDRDITRIDEVRNSNRTAKDILFVPQYDFNWQHTYQLRQPLKLDNIERLRFEATFDNSTDNPFNPDADQLVTWGDQTWEEMAVVFFEISVPLIPTVGDNLSPQSSTAELADVNLGKQASEYVDRVLRELDANRDGIIRKAEADIVVRHMHFSLWDINHDNVVTRQELQEVAETRVFE